MRNLLAIGLMIGLMFSGCATLGIGTGGNTATRIIADIGCITALAAAGVQLAGDPMVNGATTAMGVLAAIGAIGASNMPGTVLNACAATMQYAAEDAAGLLRVVTGTNGTTGTTVLPTARRGAVPRAPAAPTPVQVVIPGR